VVTRVTNGRPQSLLLLAAGTGLALAGIASALSGTSRAVATWITPLAVALLGAGTWGYASGRTAPRWVLVLLAVVAVALTVIGLSTWIYSWTRPPQLA
jgi:predicted nicotinamide N-methyase